MSGGYSVEKILEVLFNNHQDGLLIVNEQGIIDLINDTLSKAIKQSRQFLVGRPLHVLGRRNLVRRLNQVLRTGKAEWGKLENINGQQAVVDYLPVDDHGRVTAAVARLTFLPSSRNEEEKSKWKIRGDRSYRESNLPISYTLEDIIGVSPQMIDLKETISKVAPRNSTVLLTGESGTGKEMFAQAIHAASMRRSAPFVKINCAAIPSNLLESELFGYEEGAFTGSRRGGMTGKLELADGGTVFLDEIGELPFGLQAKLLRFLQEKEIQKLGSREVKRVDVRVIAATNVNLEQLVRYNKFRSDLYFRLNVVNLHIPPLRERREDIPELVRAFIQKFNRIFGLGVTGVTPEVEAAFFRYAWPGNVRELENVIERAFNLVEGNVIELQHLPPHFSELLGKDGEGGFRLVDGFNAAVSDALRQGFSLEQLMDQLEKLVIIQALNLCHGNKVKASQLLRISRPGLYKKLCKYQLL